MQPVPYGLAARIIQTPVQAPADQRVQTSIYATTQHWQVSIPVLALYSGIGTALIIGAIAGLYPATRAARLSPAEALRTT